MIFTFLSTDYCCLCADPTAVLKLLQTALPMEKLTTLIRTERRADKKQLKFLQKQLEGECVCVSSLKWFINGGIYLFQ